VLVLLAQAEPVFDEVEISAYPTIVMLLAGFVLGAIGHLYGSKSVVGAALLLIVVGLFVLPAVAYLSQ
jgi:uncharacterized membrane protein